VAYDQLANTIRPLTLTRHSSISTRKVRRRQGRLPHDPQLHKANEPTRIVSALNHLNENLQRQEEIKSDAWRKNTLFWIAEGYYSIQDYKHAEVTYSRFVELAPDHPMIRTRSKAWRRAWRRRPGKI